MAALGSNNRVRTGAAMWNLSWVADDGSIMSFLQYGAGVCWFHSPDMDARYDTLDMAFHREGSIFNGVLWRFYAREQFVAGGDNRYLSRCLPLKKCMRCVAISILPCDAGYCSALGNSVVASYQYVGTARLQR